MRRQRRSQRRRPRRRHVKTPTSSNGKRKRATEIDAAAQPADQLDGTGYGDIENAMALFQEGENSNGPISWIEEDREPDAKKGKRKIKDEHTEDGGEDAKKNENAEAQIQRSEFVWICGICLSDEHNGQRGKLDCCEHFFCFDCIIEWSKVESKCPMCKQRFMTIVKSTHPGQPACRSRTIHVPIRDQAQTITAASS